jgi:pilus assembly protein CpaE
VDAAAQEVEQPAAGRGGRVIAVFGARPDVGVTSIATSLANAFRSLGEEDVAFAEMDPRVVRARSQGGPEGPPESSAKESNRITIPGANAALVRRMDGIWLLAMIRPRTPATVEAKAVTVALETIRERFPVTIAELEHQVNERTLAAFDAADRILLVTESSVPSIRATQRALRLCHRLNYPDEKMCVVLNRFDAPGALDVADVAGALKRELFWKIPTGERADSLGLARKLSE